MSSMKDYKNAVDRMQVSDRVEQELFAEAENGGTRRIVKHSAWQKPVAAAAVAAVVGLNVFAVMKLRQDAGTLLPGKSGSSAAETAETGIDLPDLSAYGIDTDAFAYAGEYKKPGDAEWFYKSDLPNYTMNHYINRDADEIDLDDEGRFVRYLRVKEIEPLEDGAASDIDLTQTAIAFMETVLEDGAVLKEDGRQFNLGQYDYETPSPNAPELYLFTCSFTRQNGANGTASVLLAETGTVWVSTIIYYEKVEDEAPYRAEAERLIRENFDPDYSISPSSQAIWYKKLSGEIYGFWMYEEHELLVCASNPDADLISEETQLFPALSDNVFTLDYVGEDPLRNVIWCYSSDLPAQTYYMYRCAKTEEEVYTDAQGRITRYLAPNPAAAAIIPDADALSRKAEQLAKDVTGAAKLGLYQAAESDVSDAYTVYRYFAFNEDDEIFAEVMIELTADGTVRTYLADYLDWDGAQITDAQAAAFQQEADRLVAEGRYENADYCWYVACGGKVYAKYLPEMPNPRSRMTGIMPLIVSLDEPVDDEPVKTLSPSALSIELYMNGTDFVKSETPYTGGEQGCINDMQINGYWGYDAARPTEEWTEYVHTDGMRIVTDASGNIRRMFGKRKANDPNKTYTNEEIAQREETFRRGAESYIRDAQKILAAAYPGTTWDVDMSTIWDMNVSLFEIIFVRTENGAETYDKAFFYFDQDGDIDTFTCDMVEVGAHVPAGAQAAFDEEAARILNEVYNVPAENIEGKYFDLFGGSTYGFYSFTDNEGSERVLIVDPTQPEAQAD